MKNAIKGALLSGLVLPGLGQIVLKRYARGIAFLLVALGSLFVVATTAAEQIVSGLQGADPNALTNIRALQGMASRATQSSAGGISEIAMWVLAICWAWAIVDAYLIGRKMDRM